MIHSMFPVIHYPTRVTINSATLIDNIFTNDIENIDSGILLADISDHFPIFCVHSSPTKNDSDFVFIRRDMCESNIQCFIEKLKNIPWRINSENPNMNYDCFLYQFKSLYNECFPIVRITYTFYVIDY